MILGKQFIILNLCGILVMYIIFLKSFEDEVSRSKTSIMIQHFNKIINNKIDIKGTQIDQYEEIVLNEPDLNKQVSM